MDIVASVKARFENFELFQFTKLLGSVDVSCLVGPGGCSAQAGAI